MTVSWEGVLHRPPGVRARRRLLSLLSLVPLLTVGCDALAPGHDTPGAELLWDRYGVPHIYAEAEEALFHAHGWAQMEAHGELLLRLYGEARGRAAEYWGEEHLAHDHRLWTLGLPSMGLEWWEESDPEERARVDAFVAGINQHASEHEEELPEEVRRVLPVESADVHRHLARLVVGDFLLAGSEDASGRWREGVEVGAANQGERGADATGVRGGASSGEAGSMAWAVGPDHSTSGRSLLLANPHLPWGGRHTFFEVHLNLPEVDVYGATLVGLPVPVLGFNRALGWTHTTSPQRAWDLFELELAGGGYLLDGEPRPFQLDTVALQVGDGSGADTLVVRRGEHGPLLDRLGRRGLALRHPGQEYGDLLGRWWGLARARDLEEFEAILSGGPPPPGLTVTYADGEGNILHHGGGTSPRRETWDPEEGTGPLDGTSSEALWTEIHSYEEGPRTLNPPSGWLQNANEGSWYATVPPEADPSTHPPYLAPEGPLPLRSQRSIELLGEGPLTLEEMIERKHSTHIPLADRVLDDLVEAARASGDGPTMEAARILEEWDRGTNSESAGAVLFVEWARDWLSRAGTDPPETGGGPFAEEWSPDAPLTTPSGLADPAAATRILSARARALQGPLDQPWGEVYRIRRDTLDLPAAGGPGSLGTARVLEYQAGGGGRMEAAYGDTFVLAVEFSDPPRAFAILPYGNASQEGSPHRTDQIGLFARMELRPIWLDRAEVEENLGRRVSF